MNAREVPTQARRAAGFALVPALFLLVVLGALGIVAIRVGTGQQQAVTMGLMQARALAAAKTGIEWGAYQALHGTCTGGTLTLTEGALSGFSVVVSCNYSNFTNGSGNNNYYSIQSAASAGTYGQPGYVHRAIVATLTDATS
jgi:MSHA biogenesis protein MshP